MALSSSARPLLVPAADVLAKNMQAQDAARVPPAVVAASSGRAPHGTRRTLIGLGSQVEDETVQARSAIRFRRAPADDTPSFLATLTAKLFPKKLSAAERAAETARRKRDKSALQKAMARYMPAVEKASALASRLPDPTVLFLGLVLAVLLMERMRPAWLARPLIKAGVIGSFTPLLVLALVWRKTELFAQLREGHNPLSHPTEHCLDALEETVRGREMATAAGQETLRSNRGQLDALRKELAKDPQSRDPEAVLVPSKKAAAMIAAGALGAGYDAEAAHAVEQRRVEENMRRCREMWKERSEDADADVVERTKERIQQMASHSATAYTKRTREIKSRGAAHGGGGGGGGGGIKAAEKYMRGMAAAAAARKESERAHGARASETSAAGSTAASTASARKGRRGRFWKRARRLSAAASAAATTEDEGGEDGGASLTPRLSAVGEIDA